MICLSLAYWPTFFPLKDIAPPGRERGGEEKENEEKREERMNKKSQRKKDRTSKRGPITYSGSVMKCLSAKVLLRTQKRRGIEESNKKESVQKIML